MTTICIAGLDHRLAATGWHVTNPSDVDDNDRKIARFLIDHCEQYSISLWCNDHSYIAVKGEVIMWLIVESNWPTMHDVIELLNFPRHPPETDIWVDGKGIDSMIEEVPTELEQLVCAIQAEKHSTEPPA